MRPSNTLTPSPLLKRLDKLEADRGARQKNESLIQIPTAVDLMRLSGMEPDPWQHEVATHHGDQLLLCHRQAGKSTIVGAVALEDTISEENALVLCVSRSLRQSGELFRKVKNFYNRARPMPLIRDTALSMELENGSRIVSLPGNEETLVGFSSVKRLIIDEAARTSDPMYYALRPMLAMSRGTILALSTPWGKRGWFFEAWEGVSDQDDYMTPDDIIKTLAEIGLVVDKDEIPTETELEADTWKRTKFTALDSTRLSKVFLAKERRNIPDLWFRQEWLCEFVDAVDSVFRYEDIQNALNPDLAPLFLPKEQPVVNEKIQPLFMDAIA